MSSTARQQGKHPPAMTTRSVRTFFALTFGISWGMVALLMAFPDQTQAIFGEMGYTNPAFILIVYTPGIVGVLMVWRHYGLTGLRSFLRRLTLWRMSMRWWLLLALGMPAVFYLGATLKGTITDPFPFSPWYQMLPALIPALFIGPVEEFGWRGVALPLLQRRFAPLWAGLILGVISALWHTPAFLVSGTKQSAWSYGPFFLGVVAISVILTAMFNASGGSLLVAVLFHFQMNGPAWPDAQPWDTLIFVIVAAIIVILNRAAMLTPDRAATAVLMPDDEPATQPHAREAQMALP
jgi:membrane protease YdiL (CAAX protease family)